MQWTITGNASDWQSFGTITTDDNGCANVDVPYFQEAFRVRGVTAYEEKNQDGTITRHWIGVTSVASPGVHHESLGLFDVYCHPMNNFKCPPGTQIPLERTGVL
ncbi:hypothetical protein [Arthrobacter sp. Marseille-P9274]|uniref:hypothetical protein n=1 Tax=Arthrobacter sp. Marseille-P9274 TaxID=2866572 RepID=UPI0021C5B72D|nr:hypothetical protein [Arthrobacter sp. Marseille-P9274]